MVRVIACSHGPIFLPPVGFRSLMYIYYRTHAPIARKIALNSSELAHIYAPIYASRVPMRKFA
nr:MAG TPA: hypothetical protein [Caudoviricetes sp.]